APAPAPPSPTPPPVAVPKPPPPQVNESRTAPTEPPARTAPAKPNKDLVQVSFWNLTERALRFTINGEERVVPSRQHLMLTLPRQFTWQLGQRAVQVEQVPDDRTSLDLVFRR